MTKSFRLKAVALVFITIITLSLSQGCSSNNSFESYYNSGIEAYKSGDLELARSFFTKCGEYKDAYVYLETISAKQKSSETNNPSVNPSEVVAESTTLNETSSAADYYVLAVKAYDDEKFQEALGLFESTDGYNDSDVYIELCEDAILLNNVLAWADSLPQNLLPRITEIDGKDQVIRYRSSIGIINANDGKDYDVIYFLDMHSTDAEYTIRYLQYIYPNRTRDEIIDLLKDPALD